MSAISSLVTCYILCLSKCETWWENKVAVHMQCPKSDDAEKQNLKKKDCRGLVA